MPKTSEPHKQRADRYERFLRELLDTAEKATVPHNRSIGVLTGTFIDRNMFASYAAASIAAQLKTREELNAELDAQLKAEGR